MAGARREERVVPLLALALALRPPKVVVVSDLALMCASFLGLLEALISTNSYKCPQSEISQPLRRDRESTQPQCERKKLTSLVFGKVGSALSAPQGLRFVRMGVNGERMPSGTKEFVQKVIGWI